ncbi:MAG: alpha/beta hydrolase [Beutenbergiaceae bacterium]
MSAVAAVGALLISGASAASAQPAPAQVPAQVDAPVPSIDWGPCEGELVSPEFECATVEVPSDYDKPRGKTTTIAVTRLPASNPYQRIGSVFLNFGGPGGPGVETLHQLGGTFLDPRIRESFDIIGFDPRAVGQSDPATCFPDAATEAAFFADVPAFPVTKAEERSYTRTMRTLARACSFFSGERISHGSTANVARDMDLLRQAVGDEQLSYIGYSYGTVLGATYAALFPDRVRALVLDGTVDPTLWSRGPGSVGQRLGQGPAADETFEQFLTLCAQAGEEGCVLAGLGDPREIVDKLLANLKRTPLQIPLPDGTTQIYRYSDVTAINFSLMYSPALWPLLAALLAEMALLTSPQQAGSAIAPEHRRGSDRESVGEILRRLGLIEDYPSIGGSLASLCVDMRHPLTPWQYRAQADRAEQEAPYFGRYRSWAGIQCEFVNFRDRDAYRGPWQQTTDAPVMVIGTRYDPATAYSMTRPYADLWPDARMMTVEGYGHTTVGVSVCADQAIGTYLLTLEATDGAVCGQDFEPFQVFAGEIPDDQLLLAPRPRITTVPSGETSGGPATR